MGPHSHTAARVPLPPRLGRHSRRRSSARRRHQHRARSASSTQAARRQWHRELDAQRLLRDGGRVCRYQDVAALLDPSAVRNDRARAASHRGRAPGTPYGVQRSVSTCPQSRPVRSDSARTPLIVYAVIHPDTHWADRVPRNAPTWPSRVVLSQAVSARSTCPGAGAQR